jgi:hypothetical protein
MEEENMEKKCMRCDETKETSMFYKNKHKKDGLQVYCKPCMKNENKKNYINHKDTWDERTKQYNKTDSSKKYRREWAKNKYDTNEEYKQTCIKNAVKYERNMLNTNIEYKIKHVLRSRIRDALKKHLANKYRNTNDLTSCTMEELKLHLEAKFTEGMTWENHGDWHIDHIKPCCSFDLKEEEEQKKCFHYTNLQPLWAKDNLSKGGKYQCGEN